MVEIGIVFEICSTGRDGILQGFFRSFKGTGFQVKSEDLLNIAVTLKFQLYKHSDLLRGIITPSQKKAVAAFVQAPGDYFDADPTFKQSYAPQSGEIFGILKQMKETFENNLSASQKEEMANQAAYEDLKAAKLAEIAAGNEQKDTKTQELADTDSALAQVTRGE